MQASVGGRAPSPFPTGDSPLCQVDPLSAAPPPQDPRVCAWPLQDFAGKSASEEGACETCLCPGHV